MMVDCLYEEIKKKIDSLFNETKLLMKEKDSKATNGGMNIKEMYFKLNGVLIIVIQTQVSLCFLIL